MMSSSNGVPLKPKFRLHVDYVKLFNTTWAHSRPARPTQTGKNFGPKQLVLKKRPPKPAEQKVEQTRKKFGDFTRSRACATTVQAIPSKPCSDSVGIRGR